jgi:hypothetical protein
MIRDQSWAPCRSPSRACIAPSECPGWRPAKGSYISVADAPRFAASRP